MLSRTSRLRKRDRTATLIKCSNNLNLRLASDVRLPHSESNRSPRASSIKLHQGLTSCHRRLAHTPAPFRPCLLTRTCALTARHSRAKLNPPIGIWLYLQSHVSITSTSPACGVVTSLLGQHRLPSPFPPVQPPSPLLTAPPCTVAWGR